MIPSGIAGKSVSGSFSPYQPDVQPQQTSVAAATGTVWPTGSPIHEFNTLLKSLKDEKGEYVDSDGIHAAFDGLARLFTEKQHQKLLWQARQMLMHGNSDSLAAGWEQPLRKALLEKAGGPPAFQQPVPDSTVTPKQKKINDILAALDLTNPDLQRLELRAAVRDAIPLLPAGFLARSHEVSGPGGEGVKCRIYEVNGGHVFQTKTGYRKHERTKVFFPADAKAPFAEGELSAVEKLQLKVLVTKVSMALQEL